MRLKAMDLAIELLGALALVFITLVGTVLAVAFATRRNPENLAAPFGRCATTKTRESKGELNDERNRNATQGLGKT